jgi:acyl-CoA thioester hydrolase
VTTKIGHDPIHTYRGVADAWECDQMQHMNVRFIGERFSRADSFLFASLGLDHADGGVVRLESERLTFSKEIVPGKPLLIESGCSYDAQSNVLSVRHDLKFADSGTLSATAITRYHVDKCPQALAANPAKSIPYVGAIMDNAPVQSGLVFDPQVELSECGRTFLSSGDYKNGDLSRETLVRLINHAASCAGLDRGRRQPEIGQSGIGSATLDIRVKRCSLPRQTLPVLVMSGLKARSAKTIIVLHRLIDATTSDVIAEAASTHVFFEIASRAAIRIPTAVSMLIADARCTEL